MSYRVEPTAQALADIERIFDWLSTRSVDGASRWYDERAQDNRREIRDSWARSLRQLTKLPSKSLIA